MAEPTHDDLYMMRLAKRRATVLVRGDDNDMRPATLISWRYGRGSARARVQFTDGASQLVAGSRIEIREQP